MQKQDNNIDTKNHNRGTKRRYSYQLKRRIVHEILRGVLSKEEAILKYDIKSRQSVNYWLNVYGSLNYRPEKNYGMKESPDEKIKRLQAQIEELETEKIILNTAIDIADEMFNTHIRKKFLSQPLKGSNLASKKDKLENRRSK